MSENLKIIITGKCFAKMQNGLSDVLSDSCTIASSIEDAVDTLYKLRSESLVVIFDSNPDTFYALFRRMKEMPHHVQLLLLYPDKRYFMMGDNELNNAIVYHLPIKPLKKQR